ncbi:hypothetical protein ACLB1Q_20800 [Escherichia coli]
MLVPDVAIGWKFNRSADSYRWPDKDGASGITDLSFSPNKKRPSHY